MATNHTPSPNSKETQRAPLPAWLANILGAKTRSPFGLG